MNCINCSQELPSMIVMNTNIYTLSTYISWRKDNEGLCLECYTDKKKMKKDKAM